MKLPELKNMTPIERREFLLALSGLMAAPFLPKRVIEAIGEVLSIPEAAAQMAPPVNFIEVNFRDQWDFASLFVPPTIAANYANIRSQLAVFNPPTRVTNSLGNAFYLTEHAEELRPHLDHIAVLEVGECVLSGSTSIHGHEAGNPLRSPGRTQQSGSGRIDMATVDKRPGTGGNEILYSSTPTPLILHNSYQKSRGQAPRNGVILRSSLRSNIHTFYHFEANLANAQADRFMSKTSFLTAFAQPTMTPVQTAIQRHGAAIARFLGRVDRDYLQRALATQAQQTKHQANTVALQSLLVTTPPPATVNLTETELAYWKANIGDQAICDGDSATACRAVVGTWHPGEVFGYAFKMIQSGTVRTVGIDIDFHDVHTSRTPFVMTTQGSQSGRTLGRLITQLKQANLWDSTVIAMYTLDGSRSPHTNSTGDGSKNAVILAGGRVRGGYYGDIAMTTGGQITYYRPDANGNPLLAEGSTGRDRRVPAADVYKTVMTAAGVPESVINTFPDAATGRLLSYMLR